MKLTENGKCLLVCGGFWITALLFILWVTRASGDQVTLRWNANPPEDSVTSYRIYRIAPEPRALLAITGDTSITIELQHLDSVVLTAVNVIGESLDSVPFTYRIYHGVPTVRVTLQISEDLKDWTDWQAFDIPTESAAFYRLKIEKNSGY